MTSGRYERLSASTTSPKSRHELPGLVTVLEGLAIVHEPEDGGTQHHDGNQPCADRSHDEREHERQQHRQHDQRSRRSAEELGVHPGRQFRAHEWIVTGKCRKNEGEGEIPTHPN